MATSPADDGTLSAASGDADRAYREVPGRLEELGRWCDEQRLLAQRARIAETLLSFDPDHEEARNWLGYRRGEDKGWRRGSIPVLLDVNKDALPEWERRRGEFVAPFRGTTRTPLPPTRDPKTAGLRNRVARALVAIGPDDPVLHDLAGETRLAGQWVLKETAVTSAGRRRIADAVRAARSSTSRSKPVYVLEPDRLATFTMGGFMVHSDYPRAPSEEIAFAVLHARELFARVFETTVSPPAGLQVYVLNSHWSHVALLKSHREITDERRKRCERLASYWLSDHELVSRDDEQSGRVDGIVRQTISDLKSELGRMCSAADWMGEGMGMYLTHALVGTRLTVFTQPTEYSDDTIARDAVDTRSDWVALARRMVDRGFDPKIPILVGLPLNSMTKDDGLFAYALGAYFLESRIADARQLVKRTNDGLSFHEALAEVCGLDAEGLQHRFVRWLRETGR